MQNRSKFLKNIAVFLLFTGQFSPCLAQNQLYLIDSNRSEIAFQISHMAFLTVNGKFTDYEGNLSVHNGKLQSVDCKIIVQSLDSNDKTRDESLMDKAYLDAEIYPFILFSSTKIVSTGNTSLITGILRIKNREKKVSIPYEFRFSKDRKEIQLRLATELNRKDFGLDFGPMDTLIGDNITVDIEILGLALPEKK